MTHFTNPHGGPEASSPTPARLSPTFHTVWAVIATLRDRLRAGDVWVEGSRDYRQDGDYWDALNAISGRLITVFFFEKPAPKPQPFQFMTKVPAGTYKPRHILQQHFDIPQVSLPAILFFQATKDGITGCCLGDLPDGTIEDTYQALQKVIRTAAQSMKKVTPDNRGNYEEIFNLVRGALEEQRTGVRVWMALKRSYAIGQLLVLLKSFA